MFRAEDVDRTDRPPPRYRVGDRVQFRRGPDLVVAVVTEDRGLIGYKGRRLYGIRFALSDGEPMYVERPEEEMEPAT